MNFKEYLQEIHNIFSGQAAVAHEPTGEASLEVQNPIAMARINAMLSSELSVEVVLSPHAGFQKIRKVLHRYGFYLPVIYEMDPEGDEMDFELFQFGRENGSPDAYVYIIYVLGDHGYYEFYAEVVDEHELEEIYKACDDGEEEVEEE